MRERDALPKMQRGEFYERLEGDSNAFLFIANTIWKWKDMLQSDNPKTFEDARKKIVTEAAKGIAYPETRPRSPRRNNRHVKDLAGHLEDLVRFRREDDPVERIKIERSIEERAQFMNTTLLAHTNSAFWAIAHELARYKNNYNSFEHRREEIGIDH